jgi:hypothetical protein
MRSTMSFTEKRISMNAAIAFAIGVVLNMGHVIMTGYSFVQKGNVPFAGDVVESYILLFGIFGLLWAVMSLDDEKTNRKYKVSGIILNGISLALSFVVMGFGVVTY